MECSEADPRSCGESDEKILYCHFKAPKLGPARPDHVRMADRNSYPPKQNSVCSTYICLQGKVKRVTAGGQADND